MYRLSFVHPYILLKEMGQSDSQYIWLTVAILNVTVKDFTTHKIQSLCKLHSVIIPTVNITLHVLVTKIMRLVGSSAVIFS